MVITIDGPAASGKSTVAKLLAKRLGYDHYSSGDFMRDMAEEMHIDFFELTKQAETDASIDQEIDQRQIKFGKEQDNVGIDGILS